MGYQDVTIPEKLYFKIGEVCDLVGVQAHVLRYWETEFPQLAPQKNRSGQRSYRKRDVEISIRIKELLYDDLYTIAGARKKLAQDTKENGKNRPGNHETGSEDVAAKIDHEFEPHVKLEGDLGSLHLSDPDVLSSDGREALRSLSSSLLELREMLRATNIETYRE